MGWLISLTGCEDLAWNEIKRRSCRIWSLLNASRRLTGIRLICLLFPRLVVSHLCGVGQEGGSAAFLGIGREDRSEGGGSNVDNTNDEWNKDVARFKCSVFVWVARRECKIMRRT